MADKLKILYQVPTLCAGNKNLRKAFDTFFWLKHIYDNGIITDYSRFAGEYAEECNISERTWWTRIALMKRFKLVKRSGRDLKLASWGTVCHVFDIKYEKFYYLKYEEDSTIEHILIAKAIQEKKRNFDRGFSSYVNTHKLDAQLRNVCGGVSTRQAVLKHSITAFKHPSLYTEAEIRLLNTMNADDNFNSSTLSRLFGCKSASSATYIKKLLEGKELISCTHRKIDSEERSRRHPSGTVFYSRRNKHTFLIMPDALEVA